MAQVDGSVGRAIKALEEANLSDDQTKESFSFLSLLAGGTPALLMRFQPINARSHFHLDRYAKG